MGVELKGWLRGALAVAALFMCGVVMAAPAGAGVLDENSFENSGL